MPAPPARRVWACIGLGSNLGDRRSHLEAAFGSLAGLLFTTLVRRSTIIETEPLGPPGQGRYLNAAAIVSTALTARQLLHAFREIERSRGRRRPDPQKWGPRTLDLDLLLYGDWMINEPGLIVPHPRMHQRLFVLEPLAEIAADVAVPGRDKTVAALLADLRAANARIA